MQIILGGLRYQRIIKSMNIIYVMLLLFYVQGCEDGYFGPNCTTPCRYPSFGQRCQEECNCLKRKCDPKIGCLNIHGCAEGYHGPDCLLHCRYPSYGKKCQSICKCTILKCNHVKGCNNLTETYMLTTIWDHDSEKERNLMYNYQEAVIIGSCSLLMVFAMGIMAKIYINRYKQQRNYSQSDCISIPTNNFSMRITSFKNLKLDGDFDPDLYENTQY